MSAEQQELSLSVLVTREEYSEAAAQRSLHRGRGRGMAVTGAGCALVVAGLAGVFFGGRISLSPVVAACVVLVGLILAGYRRVFAPLLDRAEAAREYDEKDDLHYATVFRFSGDTVEVKNGRVEAALPLSLITEWLETPTLISFSFGREFRFAIPKRLLSEEQTAELRRRCGRGNSVALERGQ